MKPILGFSLIELFLFLSILGILIFLAVPFTRSFDSTASPAFQSQDAEVIQVSIESKLSLPPTQVDRNSSTPLKDTE